MLKRSGGLGPFHRIFGVDGAGLDFALQGLDVTFMSHSDTEPRLVVGS